LQAVAFTSPLWKETFHSAPPKQWGFFYVGAPIKQGWATTLFEIRLTHGAKPFRQQE
jgi:hypothetical protein